MSKWKYIKKIHSLRQRMVIMAGLGIMAWCIILSFFIIYIFRNVEKNRVENNMKSDLYQISEQMDEDYAALVSMSQQMAPEGNIGRILNQYMGAVEPYERIELSASITSSINTMIFTHPSISLVSYLELGEKEEIRHSLFASLPVRKEADPRKLQPLMQTNVLSLQGIHTCLNELSNKQVISLVRRVQMGNGRACIYAEQFVKTLQTLEELGQMRGFSYIYLQLDENQVICYSNHNQFAMGTVLKELVTDSEKACRMGEYRYVVSESQFGFYNVLLVPQPAYAREEHYWQINVGLTFCAGMITIILVIVMFYYYIYKPVKLLGREMKEAGKGNLTPVAYHFYIDEFDQLFAEFNHMKENVARLMEEGRRREHEKQQLEIDKLYYQINPHFLMNALNSLHWMAVEKQQKDIDEYIYQLNFILGYSLGKIYKNATFRTEIKSLEMYLELQKKRYDFNVWLDISLDRYLDYPCARLILQPLAENAICHNMDAFGNLWITMNCDGEKAVLTIRDDGLGIRQFGNQTGDTISASRLNKGIGLRYVQLSLESFYSGRATISIESEVNQGTAVTIVIPIKREEKKDV